MNEYKAHKKQFFFKRLDLDRELINDLLQENEIIIDDEHYLYLQDLLNSIQKANIMKNEDEIDSLITKLNFYINTQKLSPHLLYQFSGIIPILINQLNRPDYLDKIKLNSIQCLHKLMFIYAEIENIAIENQIKDSLEFILQCPVTSTTHHALCILINIFSDVKELIPDWIDSFNPKIILNLFVETKYEKGFARLIAISIREKLKPLICKLFIQYSTVKINDEYLGIMLKFFDSLIFHQTEKNFDFYITILQAIRGIFALFLTNNIILEYIKIKSNDLFNIILNALNFFQNLNNFDIMSEYIELLTNLIHLDAIYTENQINSIIQIIFNSFSIIDKINQNECINFKINSFNLFKCLIEKKCIFNHEKIVFENAIINLLCNSIENDSFEVGCAAFSLLTQILNIASNNQIQLILKENVFQSLFKIMQTDIQEIIIETISSFLVLFMKSQKCRLDKLFANLLLSNGFDIREVIEIDLLPTDILGQLNEMLNSIQNDS